MQRKAPLLNSDSCIDVRRIESNDLLDLMRVTNVFVHPTVTGVQVSPHHTIPAAVGPVNGEVEIFRDYVYPDGEALNKRWRFFLAQMSKEAYGRRWRKKSQKGHGIIWTCASERQRRGVLHYHALFGNVGEMRRLTWMDHWNRLAGFAKITTIASQPSVNTYCAKYVIKGGQINMGSLGFSVQLGSNL